MEMPIQVAVRVHPNYPNEENCIQMIPATSIEVDGKLQITPGIVQLGVHTFPVAHALPIGCVQGQVYSQTVYPLINLFLDGFDVSIVTYGQRATGKTYTIYGPGFDCATGEADQGVLQRSVRDIFSILKQQQSEHSLRKTFSLFIGWHEIIGHEIHDLLDSGVGNVRCSTVGEVFDWLKIGMQNRGMVNKSSHNIFSITIEQQWISPEGLLQHRLSTISFCDLCSTDRTFSNIENDSCTSLPNDIGLQVLESIIHQLSAEYVPALQTNNIISGPPDYNKSLLTTLLKESFGGQAHTLLFLCISPLERDITESLFNLEFALKVQCVRNYVVMNTFPDNNTPLIDVIRMQQNQSQPDPMGLQFAATQWLKLVSNAENLFTKLISDKAIDHDQRDQIEEWLYAKQECEDCLSSGELHLSASGNQQRTLRPIPEAIEPDEDETEAASATFNSEEIESDIDQPDLKEKMEILMDEFRSRTDQLVGEKWQIYAESQSKKNHEELDDEVITRDVRGRRLSLHPGHTLSSTDMDLLNRVANENKISLDSSLEATETTRHTNNIENIQKKLIELSNDIESKKNQMIELERKMRLKKDLITELRQNRETKGKAKNHISKKIAKLEVKSKEVDHQIKQAISKQNKSLLEDLKKTKVRLMQDLHDLVSIKSIAKESEKQRKEHEKSINEIEKELDILKRMLEKDKKLKKSLEDKLKTEKLKDSRGSQSGKNKNLNEVAARISVLDHVMKEKSQYVDQWTDDIDENTKKVIASKRLEIKNLRSTKERLVELKHLLDKKLKKNKMLSDREERKRLEFDEAIDAIDTAIEFKNESISGRKSSCMDINEKYYNEKGERMLMERLNNLSVEEMRILLFRYFKKVVNLRESTQELERELVALEIDRDEWKKVAYSNAQSRLESDNKALMLQNQEEARLALMLRHLANSSNSSSTERTLPHIPNPLPLDFYNPSGNRNMNQQLVKAHRNHANMEMRAIDYPALSMQKLKYRDSRKIMDQFQRIQLAGSSEKEHPQNNQPHIPIPQQNLKQLQAVVQSPQTTVTRKKNKLIIQQD